MATTKVSICMENVAFEPLITDSETVDFTNPGMAIDIALQAAKKVEIELTFIRRPWARCLSLVAKGKINGLLPSARTDTRMLTYQFPANKNNYLVLSPYHIFYATNSKHSEFYKALTTAHNKTKLTAPELNYGVTASYGYIANNLLADLGLLSNHYYTPDIGLKMVANNKLDGYVMMRSIGQGKLAQFALLDQVKATEQPLLSEKLYIVFNKEFYIGKSQLIDSFWQQLRLARVEKLDNR